MLPQGGCITLIRAIGFTQSLEPLFLKRPWVLRCSVPEIPSGMDHSERIGLMLVWRRGVELFLQIRKD